MIALLRRQLRHTGLILGSFRGNTRGCIITEPLWGIPFNLYIAYSSLYMLALGGGNPQHRTNRPHLLDLPVGRRHQAAEAGAPLHVDTGGGHARRRRVSLQDGLNRLQ